MHKRTVTPPGSRKTHTSEHAVVPGGCGKSTDIEDGSPRPSSPFAAVNVRRTRFSSVPLVELKQNVDSEIIFPASVELPRRHVTFYSDVESDSSLSAGGLCSMSDTMESFKDVGGGTAIQPSVRIKHLTRNSDGTSRFPKLDECAHFHYDNVELGPVEVTLTEGDDRVDEKNTCVGDCWFCVQVTSNGKNWQIRRSLDNFQMLDRQLHRCVYDRKFSLLKEIEIQPQQPEDALRTMLTQYLERFSQLAGSLINCGPVLNWLELDNRGNRLIVTDEAAINTPAVAAAYVTKRYASQATDEISLEVGDIISVIDMPPPAESSWWRGKKGFQVGFFPCECVEIIGDKVPQSFKIPKSPAKPVLRKHGKLIAFFRSFLLSRPSRRKLKQSGILKERVFGCDLGEHLMNTSREIPLVLKCCTEFIEQYGIVDGIYRLSGVTSNIQKLRLAFDEDRIPNLTDEAILQDIHCVASLLKMYFRELPNPLLTFHLYDKFVNAVQADEDMRLLKLRDVVQQLPPPHYRSLEYLMRHLSKVAAFGFQTGMTPKNVAIVWAPNLLRDIENGGVGALHVVGVQAVLTEYLIRYTDIIFSEKMPVFPSPKMNEETPKKTRPKSLAISTPTKLLSLEEARSRALTSNLLGDQPKFIEVGGGEENLPIKYHTIIELPTRRRSVGKSKKSPSGWKSFFSRGWQTTSGRRKNRRSNEDRIEKLKIGSPICLENSPFITQDKAVTELDVSHTNSKKLRTVKSAENLFPLKADLIQQTVMYAFSPVEEDVPPFEDENKDLKDCLSPNISPSKYSLYQKHIRSISHDSYFERSLEFTADVEDEAEDKEDDVVEMTSAQIVEESESLHFFDVKDDYSSDSANDSPAKRNKFAQKQKRLSFDTEASSPKLQKLSLKRLYHTLSSPPMEKRKEKLEKNSKALAKVKLNCEIAQDQPVPMKSDRVISESRSAPMLQESFNSVPLTDKSTHSSKLPETANRQSRETDIVTVEIHKLEAQLVENTDDKDSVRDDSCEMLATSIIDDSDHNLDFSVEATLSESVKLSQLCSFDSQNQTIDQSRNKEKQVELGIIPVESFSATPDSPTVDNLSEIPTSDDSEISETHKDEKNYTADILMQEVQNHQISHEVSCFDSQHEAKNQLGADALEVIGSNSSNQNTDKSLHMLLQKHDVDSKVTSEDKFLTSETLLRSIESPSNTAQEELNLHEKIVDDIILSPPENFVDVGKRKNNHKNEEFATVLASEIKSSSKSLCARSMERSKTEVHEICPKLVSGIAVSGSFGQELFRANSDFVESQILNKKRSCSDKLSPISPNEDSKRKFESEIGRLIVRDRQMKLEMEQMKAERQKCKVSDPVNVSDNDKGKRRNEKKFADVIEFRKSPVKLFDEKKKTDFEDLLKSQKENIEEKKASDNTSQNYSRFLRMENKPSVKELLSKFEGRNHFEGTAQKFNPDVLLNSPPKHSTSVFSNVQVINHNFPLTPSRSASSNIGERNYQSLEDNQSNLSKEHIFQTECVIRFPHPKASVLTQIKNESHRNILDNQEAKFEHAESNSWSSGQYDHHTKANHSRTSFLSSDNLSKSPGRCCNDFSILQPREDLSSENARMSRSVESKRTNIVFNNGDSEARANKEEKDDNSFSSFKDTFNRANRLTAQMRNEFLQRGLPQVEQTENGNWHLFPTQSGYSATNATHYSGSPPVSRRRQPPTRQRPKSVPPPVCRLSLASSQQTPAVPFHGSHSNFIPNEFSQNVPKTPSVHFLNGKESTYTSQTCGPPKRVRDRAALFERSMSFSGHADTKSLHKQKAQQDLSTR